MVRLLVMVGEHFDDRAIDAVFEQTPSLVIWLSFGCLSPHSDGVKILSSILDSHDLPALD